MEFQERPLKQNQCQYVTITNMALATLTIEFVDLFCLKVYVSMETRQ